MAHTALAYDAFYRITGRTPDRVLELCARRLGNAKALEGLHGALYQEMIKSEKPLFQRYIAERVADRCMIGKPLGTTRREYRPQSLRRTEHQC